MTAEWEAPPTGAEISRRSWSSVFRGIRVMAPLFVTAATFSEILAVVTFSIPGVAQATMSSRHATGLLDGIVFRAGVNVASILAWSAIAAPVAVSIHRLILLNQETSGILSYRPRYTRLFFFWLVSIRLLTVMIGSIDLLLNGSQFLASLIEFVVGIAGLIVSIHLAMIFPAIATEVSSEDWQTRLTTSWNQMRGHSWLFVRTAIITFLPWLFVYLVFWALFGGLHASRVGFDFPNPMWLPLALTIGMGQISAVALGAAMASWLFVWVRNEHPPCSSGMAEKLTA